VAADPEVRRRGSKALFLRQRESSKFRGPVVLEFCWN